MYIYSNQRVSQVRVMWYCSTLKSVNNSVINYKIEFRIQTYKQAATKGGCSNDLAVIDSKGFSSKYLKKILIFKYVSLSK